MELYEDGRYIGSISKEFSFLKPHYHIDFKGWHVDGNWLEWDYTIADGSGRRVASVSKELFHMTDTYVLSITDSENALYVLMFILALDAEKCSRD